MIGRVFTSSEGMAWGKQMEIKDPLVKAGLRR
jgi:hypothetical protein